MTIKQYYDADLSFTHANKFGAKTGYEVLKQNYNNSVFDRFEYSWWEMYPECLFDTSKGDLENVVEELTTLLFVWYPDLKVTLCDEIIVAQLRDLVVIENTNTVHLAMLGDYLHKKQNGIPVYSTVGTLLRGISCFMSTHMIDKDMSLPMVVTYQARMDTLCDIRRRLTDYLENLKLKSLYSGMPDYIEDDYDF
jgi:hypothetical protein